MLRPYMFPKSWQRNESNFIRILIKLRWTKNKDKIRRLGIVSSEESILDIKDCSG